jgi:hypothetical protein
MFSGARWLKFVNPLWVKLISSSYPISVWNWTTELSWSWWSRFINHIEAGRLNSAKLELGLGWAWQYKKTRDVLYKTYGRSFWETYMIWFLKQLYRIFFKRAYLSTTNNGDRITQHRTEISCVFVLGPTFIICFMMSSLIFRVFF